MRDLLWTPVLIHVVAFEIFVVGGMSSASLPRETAAQPDVLTFARLCPFNDEEEGSDDGRGRVEYEVLRDADDDDEDEPDEVGRVMWQPVRW